jgi:hypothetical protein
MRITDRFATPLPGNRWLLVGTGLLILGLVALSVLLSLSGTFPVALASKNALHPFTISSPDFRDGGALSQKKEPPASAPWAIVGRVLPQQGRRITTSFYSTPSIKHR